MRRTTTILPGLWVEGDILHVDGGVLCQVFGWEHTTENELAAIEAALLAARDAGVLPSGTPVFSMCPTDN